MKKFIKIVLWSLGILLVLLVLLVVGLRLFFPFDKAKQMAIEKGQEALGRDIQIGDVDISFWGGLGIKLKDVVVGNPAGMESVGDFLQAENVDVKLQILPLLSGEYRLHRLIVNQPHVIMYKKTDGSDNFTFSEIESKSTQQDITRVPSETKTAIAAVSFDKLEINNGELEYINDSTGITARLSDINLESALDNSRQHIFTSTGQLAVGKVSLSGTFPFPATSFDLRWSADYNLDEKNLLLKSTELKLGNLTFTVSGDLTHTENKFLSHIAIQSDGLTVADLLSLMSPQQRKALEGITIDGDLSFNTDVTYDRSKVPSLDYSGSAIIAGLKMTYREVNGTLQIARAQLHFKPDNLRINIEEGTFNNKPLKGHVVINDFENPVVNGEIGGELNLQFVQPFLPVEQEPKLGGDARFSVKVSGMVKKPTELDVSGTVVVRSGYYASTLLPEPIESFELDAFFDNHVLRINSFSAKSMSGSLSFSGRLTDLVPYFLADSASAETVFPGIDGSLKGQINLAVLNSLLSADSALNVTGTLDMDMTVNGEITKPGTIQPRGSIVFTDVTYHDTLLSEPITDFDAKFVLSPDTAWIKNMTIRFVSSDLSLQGSIVRPIPYLLPLEGIDRSAMKKPLVLFEMQSHRFNVDSLFPEAAPGTTQLDSSISGSADTLVPPVFPDITGYGRFTIDTLVYSRVELTTITGKAEIKDRQIVCSNVSGDVYSGRVTGDAAIDFSNMMLPVYSGKFQARQIEADDFMRRFTKFGGYVYGKFDFDGEYKAMGWEPEEFLRSLTMDSKAVMQNGKVVTSGVVFDALNTLAQKIGEPFHKEQRLKNLKTKIIIEDGKVKLDNLTSRLGSLGDFTLGGYYSFDNQIAYNGSIILSKENTEKLQSKKGVLGLLGGLVNEKGSDRIKFPLIVSGTIEQPKIKIDYSSLTKNVKENILDEAGNKLKDLLH